MTPDNRYPKPSLRDWMLLGIGVVFVLGGLVILPSDRDVGVVTIAFFGPCAALFAATILRKLRFRSLRPLRVEITGGVPIRPSRLALLTSGVTVAAMGLILIAFGRSYGLVFWSLAWLIAFTGCLILFGVATGSLPSGYIQFDPDGITFAKRRWAYRTPWEAISQISAGEYHNNAALFIWLHDLDLVSVQPPTCRDRVLRHLASNQVWLGAPVVLFTSQYRMELPMLIKALERYVLIPSNRGELSRRRIPEG